VKIKVLNEAPKKGLSSLALSTLADSVPKLIKKYMAKEYRFISDEVLYSDEAQWAGLDIAIKFWENIKENLWVWNTKQKKFERAHYHPETIKIIEWVEENVAGGQRPREFATDLKKALGKEESAIPELIKKYMVKKYKFIGQPDSPGKGDQIGISGLEIAEEFWKKPSKAIWVINVDVTGKWERAHEHPETIEIIEWLEDNADPGQHPKDFAADLKKTLGKEEPNSPEPEQPEAEKETYDKNWDKKAFYLKSNGEYVYPGSQNNSGKWTAMEVGLHLQQLTDEEMMDQVHTIVGKLGMKDGEVAHWTDVADNETIDKVSKYLAKNKADTDGDVDKKFVVTKEDFEGTSLAANKWLMKAVLYKIGTKEWDGPMGTMGSGYQDVGYKILERFMNSMEDIKVSRMEHHLSEWRNIMDVHAFAVAYRHLGGKWPPQINPSKKDQKDWQVQKVDGIKVRIGSTSMPCGEYSPANSEKPLGNKQFDPQTPEAIAQGRWECNTKVEQEVLHVLEDFVTANKKPRQEIINIMIELAKHSTPGEPLHPEDNVDFLYRGSSREALSGAAFNPQAISMLKAIDWSKEVEHFYYDKDKWVKFKYNGNFKLAFPVASWTDRRNTATQFAKGGPSQNTAGARPFQFVYETTPSAAQSVQGTFIDFEELYKLQGNAKAVDSGIVDIFSGFGGYQGFDNEVLLLGQEDGQMPVEHIWVNWNFLTRPTAKGMMRKEAKEVLVKIAALEKANPDNRRVAAFEQFEQWHRTVTAEFKMQTEQWKELNDGLKWNYEKALDTVKRKNLPTGEAPKIVQKKYTKKWFERYEHMARGLYNEISRVDERHRFEHKKQIWNQDPDHPWYNLPHSVLMASNENVKESILLLHNKAQWLGQQVRAAQKIIYDPEWSTVGEYPETAIDAWAPEPGMNEEDQRPWYQKQAEKENRKGMRATLTGANAGNKFIPATGMKDVSTNKKPKSAPAGIGALEETNEDSIEEECGEITPTITLKIR